MKESEKHALNEFDAHIAVSEQDADRLHSINARTRIFVIENGVDAAYYAAAEPAKKSRLVFVGLWIITRTSMGR